MDFNLKLNSNLRPEIKCRFLAQKHLHIHTACVRGNVCQHRHLLMIIVTFKSSVEPVH